MSSLQTLRREIHRLGRHLHELRAAWRNEALHKLGEIDPKEPSATKNWLAKPIRTMRAEANGRKAAVEASQSLAELHLLNVSLGLHLALAQASRTEEAFLSQSLPEELAAMRKLLGEVTSLSLRNRVGQKHEKAHGQLLEVEAAFQRTVGTFEPLAIARDPVRLLRSAA